MLIDPTKILSYHAELSRLFDKRNFAYHFIYKNPLDTNKALISTLNLMRLLKGSNVTMCSFYVVPGSLIESKVREYEVKEFHSHQHPL